MHRKQQHPASPPTPCPTSYPVEIVDWQIFTDMWMETMWSMRMQRNHNRLAAIIRRIESMSGIERSIGECIDLALTCQRNYFAKTGGR